MTTTQDCPSGLLILFSVCVILTLSCVCKDKAPQDLMCSESREVSFVLKGRVKTAMKMKQGVTKYRLRVFTVFKGLSLLELADQCWLYVDKKLGTCPQAYLKTGDSNVYLMAGYVKNHQLWLGMCPFYYQWRNMTRKVKNGFRGNYLEHCDCKTSDCANGLYDRDCYLQHSYCAMSNSTSQCEWLSTPSLKKCLQTTYIPEE